MRSRLCLRRGLMLLIALFVLAACGNKVELMASMPEGEANEVMAALLNAGIGASKTSGKEGMVGLSVDAHEVGRAVDLLRLRGLPREHYAGMGEVFRKEGLISSPLEERARYIFALSQELRGTIVQIDGVIAARVHVVLPERSTSNDPYTPSSAAVFIKHQEGYNLDTVQPLIRKLVTNSIPSLTPERVSIVLIASQPPPVGEASAPSPVSKPEGVPMAVLGVLLALLLASCGVSGFLAWKLWRPGQRARGESPPAPAEGGP